MSTRQKRTHEQSRANAKKFGELTNLPEIRQVLDIIPKSNHIAYLRQKCQEIYGFSIPSSAAYKVMSSLDERFEPKHREEKKQEQQEPEQNTQAQEIFNQLKQNITNIDDYREILPLLTELHKVTKKGHQKAA